MYGWHKYFFRRIILRDMIREVRRKPFVKHYSIDKHKPCARSLKRVVLRDLLREVCRKSSVKHYSIDKPCGSLKRVVLRDMLIEVSRRKTLTYIAVYGVYGMYHEHNFWAIQEIVFSLKFWALKWWRSSLFTSLDTSLDNSSIPCSLCGKIRSATQFHILSNCSHSLNSGRYTWRHDSVLSVLKAGLDSAASNEWKVRVDLPGVELGSVSTIPADIHPTKLRPDVVLLNRSTNSIVLLELTVPNERTLSKSHDRKSKKYSSLRSDLSGSGWNVSLHCIEVSTLGVIPKATHSSLIAISKSLQSSAQSWIPSTFKKARKVAILCSKAIDEAASFSNWTIPPLLVSSRLGFVVE